MTRFSRRQRTLKHLVAGLGLALGAGGCAASPLVAEHGSTAWAPPVPWVGAGGTTTTPKSPAEPPKAAVATASSSSQQPKRPATGKAAGSRKNKNRKGGRR